MHMTPAVILIGGRGTRLSGLSPDLPKALVPVAGRPFLAWQLDWLFRNKVPSVILAAGYMGDKIRDWVRQQKFKDRVEVIIESKPLGTGGALKFAAKLLAQNNFWAVNGDSLLPELNFQDMHKNHLQSGAMGTIAVTRIEDCERYGALSFDNKGKITIFNEKSRKSAGWINGGIYLFNASVSAAISPDQNISIEKEIFPALAARGDLFAHQSSPPLLDMGTPEGLKTMESYLNRPQSNV